MNITKKIIASVFAASLIFGMLFFIFSKKEDFSENENRYLAEFPKATATNIKDGSYSTALEEYVKDHFPFRDDLMKIKTRAQIAAGYKMIENVHIGKDRLFQDVKDPDSTYFVQSCNKTFASFSDSSIKKTVLLIPSASEIYKEELPAFTKTADQKEIITRILSEIDCDHVIDPTDTMLENKASNNLFYNTDHHWTSFGAYHTYSLYLETVYSEQACVLDEYDVSEVSDSFKGSLYSTVLDDSKTDSVHRILKTGTAFSAAKTNSPLKECESYEYYSEEFLSMKDKYCYFGGGNFSLVVLENENALTNDEIVVVKDSFANAFAPFLTERFSKVHLIDPRFFKGKDVSVSRYVNDNPNVTEVLVLYGINSLNDGVTNFS